jgi:hypothetical protein
MQNGALAAGLSKHLLENAPKLALLFYGQAQAEFDVTIKHRSDAAPDQERCTKWHREIKAKTKFHAVKHHIQQSYVGRLEGTETLAQRLTSLRQKTFDPTTQKPKHLTVQELHQRHQFLLIEIKPDAPPADIPQLDQLFAQAVSEDLRKKLLSHLQALPTTTNNENVQRFSDLVQHAIEAEMNSPPSQTLRLKQPTENQNHTRAANKLNKIVVPEPSPTPANKSPTMSALKTLCMPRLTLVVLLPIATLFCIPQDRQSSPRASLLSTCLKSPQNKKNSWR